MSKMSQSTGSSASFRQSANASAAAPNSTTLCSLGQYLVFKYNGYMDLNYNFYGAFPLLSVVGGLLWIGLAGSLAQLVPRVRSAEFFRCLGTNTLLVLGYHGLLIGVLGLIILVVFGPRIHATLPWPIGWGLFLGSLYLICRYTPEKIKRVAVGS